MIERWKLIPDFSNYRISNFGEVFNVRRNQLMRTSRTPFGHLKITLVSDLDNERYTRSIAQLVGEAFVEPPNELCDNVIVLDGNRNNVASYNLAWRPRWFAWKYARQLKIDHPNHYYTLPIINLMNGVKYDSIIEAGVAEGVLFDDIWRSTYTMAEIFPYGSVYEIP